MFTHTHLRIGLNHLFKIIVDERRTFSVKSSSATENVTGNRTDCDEVDAETAITSQVEDATRSASAGADGTICDEIQMEITTRRSVQMSNVSRPVSVFMRFSMLLLYDSPLYFLTVHFCVFILA